MLKPILKRMANLGPSIFLGLTFAIGPMFVSSTAADGHALQSSRSMVVMNDRGGLLYNRLVALRDLKANRTPVEIRGNICYSTCTMYLGMPDVCISRNTTFGFHGPSSFGRALPTDDFETASRMIAAHYPQPLRDWYLSEGRYRINGLYLMPARQILNMGVASC